MYREITKSTEVLEGNENRVLERNEKMVWKFWKFWSEIVIGEVSRLFQEGNEGNQRDGVCLLEWDPLGRERENERKE